MCWGIARVYQKSNHDFERMKPSPMPRSLVIPRSLFGVALSLLAVIFGVLTGILVKKLNPDVTLMTTLFYRFFFFADFIRCCPL